MDRRNIAILAHADAGKTTLTERMLALCGAFKTAGSVDDGTAHTDTLGVERARGISVRSSAASGVWKDTLITIVDTPGHADFAAEVERGLWAVDGAVLAVSAVEGVQAQTELYFSALRAAKIPVVFFLNKTDRIGADRERVLRQIREELNVPVAPLWDEEAMIETACETDDALTERYLEGDLPSPAEALRALGCAARECRAYPALSGAALRGEGVDRVLDAVADFLPGPCGDPDAALCGVVFAVSPDKGMGRAALTRLFSGTISNRMQLGENKVTQIRVLRGTKIEDRGELRAGDIGLIYGLGEPKAGDVIGDAALLPPERMDALRAQPLLSAKVEPEDEKDLRALRAALMELSAEDPALNAQWVSFTQEMYVQLMGGIQTEILPALIEERFGLKCRLSAPTVLYRETIARETDGFVAYTMPKPCWAIMKFHLTPLPAGSGVVYKCTVPPTAIKPRYLKQVEQTLPQALAQGRLGWPVTDLEIELYDGSDHQWHTHPLDFAVATPMGIQDGLQRAGSVLLEPVLSCRFVVPADCGGRLMSDLATMRGRFSAPEMRGDKMVLTAELPAATSMDYPTELAAYTGGRGLMTAHLEAYEPVDLTLGRTCERRGIDPLDTAKYILSARKALQESL